MKDLTILVTCCLGDYMKETIKCYKENEDGINIKVIGTDMNDMEFNFVGVDKFYKVPRCDDPGYTEYIFEICKKENVNVLIPFNTLELEMFAIWKPIFQSHGIKVLTMDYEKLWIVNDKINMVEALEEIKIPLPIQTTVKTFKEAKKFLELYPNKTFCIKQRQGCGSRGFRIIQKTLYDGVNKPSNTLISLDDLKDILGQNKEFVIQEYLPGKEYTVDVVANKGLILGCACKENQCMENGVAMKSKIVSNKYVEWQCIEVCKELNLDYNIGFDLKCDRMGFPYIIDINPRNTATISLVRKAGINMPYIALKILLGEGVEDQQNKLKQGVSIVRRIQDIYYDSEGGEI